ncbi:MAG TPA: hypothetical protein VE196_09605 [Pseudonocardiaceae bacterium]|nr:hypothetical protein [Pseudonocardiaceae bacterium]
MPDVTDAATVAHWMQQELERKGYLDQEDAVYQITRLFGGNYIYLNDNGGSAIDKKVLRKFRQLTEDTAIWSRGERNWRKRKSGDAPGRSED